MANKIKAPDFIQKMDWDLFKEQRSSLFQLVDTIDKDIEEVQNFDDGIDANALKGQKDALNAVISLCDHIVDYAINELGMSEGVVCLTHEDDDERVKNKVEGVPNSDKEIYPYQIPYPA
ncbi:hypothetical protein OAH77_04425 [Flavobacteriaceae bacterium]|nr:hypothetical protein [Flavobacteriaceae bacterium]